MNYALRNAWIIYVELTCPPLNSIHQMCQILFLWSKKNPATPVPSFLLTKWWLNSGNSPHWERRMGGRDILIKLKILFCWRTWFSGKFAKLLFRSIWSKNHGKMAPPPWHSEEYSPMMIISVHICKLYLAGAATVLWGPGDNISSKVSNNDKVSATTKKFQTSDRIRSEIWWWTKY